MFFHQPDHFGREVSGLPSSRRIRSLDDSSEVGADILVGSGGDDSLVGADTLVESDGDGSELGADVLVGSGGNDSIE